MYYGGMVGVLAFGSSYLESDSVQDGFLDENVLFDVFDVERSAVGLQSSGCLRASAATAIAASARVRISPAVIARLVASLWT